MEGNDIWVVLRHDRTGDDSKADIILGAASSREKAAEAVLDDVFSCNARPEEYSDNGWGTCEYITDHYIYSIEKMEVDCFE